MRYSVLLFALCFLAACNSLSNNTKRQQENINPVATGQKNNLPVVATESDVPFLKASGFEPMWSLKLAISQNGSYPVTFITITKEMKGSLKKVNDDTYEGMVKASNAEKPLKLVITDKPCMHEDGITKDPQTAIVTFDGTTFSGCAQKL